MKKYKSCNRKGKVKQHKKRLRGPIGNLVKGDFPQKKKKKEPITIRTGPDKAKNQKVSDELKRE